jgi:cation:H+ antiporter
MIYFNLFLMLLVILVAAEIFTNALEHLGEKLKISEGVTGSLFAAVGTAMPETMVPLLAIFAGTENADLNHEIGVGAILGAPLMLATLAMFLLFIATLRKRGLQGHFNPERSGVMRDLNFFLIAYALACVALFLPQQSVLRVMVGGSLVLLYFIYILMTLKASEKLVEDGHGTQAAKPMFLARFGFTNNMVGILVQLTVGLVLLILGAKGFIHGIKDAALLLGLPALVLSLLIIPIATELPEKVNSFLWVRKHKDTLAFGNLTGAMVFQGTLLPAIGILLTPWDMRPEVLASVAITLAGAIWLRLMLVRGQLRVWHVLVNGALYIAYIIIALSR